ncbi:MAG: RadC family protein [Clostridia bacterium]|nr:RadC family protein [Clostridia bacterium]
MPVEKDETAVNHNGHRQRMKERYLANGLDGFSNHEVLELLLFYALPYRDTNGLAHRLSDGFGGLAQVLEADYEDLVKQPGITPHIALLISLVRDIGRRYQAELAGRVTQLSSTQEHMQYLKPWFLGQREESVVLLSMDNKHKVLNCTRIFQGSVNSAQFNPRLAVQQALRDNATEVVLAHNHPNGFAFPSAKDVETTRYFQGILHALDITLVDHIVFAENDCLSMAEMVDSGYLPKGTDTSSAEEVPLVADRH